MMSKLYTFQVDPTQLESLTAYFEYKWTVPERREIHYFYQVKKLIPRLNAGLLLELEKIKGMKVTYPEKY